MNFSKKLILNLIVMQFVSIVSLYCNQESLQDRRKYLGVFVWNDPRLEGIRWGNWGSRPYEYCWASNVVSMQGKKVIDLGVGLPSQYNWYEYAVNNLKPSFYAGIDCDGRILNELFTEKNYEIKHMDMSDLKYPNQEFDIAYCISTFEHIPYEIFMKSIQETHRVLKNDGLLVITLDEAWNKDERACHANSWNTLELSLLQKGIFKRMQRSFGLPEFLNLIKNYFVLIQEDTFIDEASMQIISNKDGYIYYDRKNRDDSILNSRSTVNSCVSYAVLKKIN